jgi:TatD DNase family protein
MRLLTARLLASMPSKTPPERLLLLPTPPAAAPVVDTHTHLASTFEAYRTRYKHGSHPTVFDMVRALYAGRNVEAVVDVWCEAPVRRLWRELADAPDQWHGIGYWFVMGVHPCVSLPHFSPLLTPLAATRRSTTPTTSRTKCASLLS